MGAGGIQRVVTRAVTTGARAAVLVGLVVGLGTTATIVPGARSGIRSAAPTTVLARELVRPAVSVTTTMLPPPLAPRPPIVAVTPPIAVSPPTPAVTTNCADALAYLAAHQAPGFADSCSDGSALGHYGYTCANVAGRCPDGTRFIRIACPAPFVYMNEAHNSWTLIGAGSGIDTYGQGSPAERAFCDAHR